MKKTIKIITLATAALAAASAAQADWNYDGDIVLGFSRGTGNDVLFNLGPASGLPTGGAGVDLSSLINNSLLADFTGSFKFGAAASDWTSSIIYSTDVPGGGIPAAINGGNFNTAAASLYNTGGLITGGDSATVAFTDPAGWTGNMVPTPDLSGSGFWSAYGDVNGTFGSSPTILDFYKAADTMPVEMLGTFTLSRDGADFSLGYVSVVPEPTTFGLLAGAGLLVLSLRRRFSK